MIKMKHETILLFEILLSITETQEPVQQPETEGIS